MTTPGIAIEVAKMRHLRIGVLATLLLIAVVGMTAFQSLGSNVSASLDAADGLPWKIILGGQGFAIAMVSPLFLAVLASRVVEMEHLGNGWLLSSTSGKTPGQLCRAKFAALGTIVAFVTILQSILLIGFGYSLGITAPLPTRQWIEYTALVLVVNLAVLACQILLSASIENQLVALGIAIGGLVLAVFSAVFPTWLAHLTPWSYYSLTTPADYIDTGWAYLDLPYLSVIGLAVVASSLFMLLTARFDQREG